MHQGWLHLSLNNLTWAILLGIWPLSLWGIDLNKNYSTQLFYYKKQTVLIFHLIYYIRRLSEVIGIHLNSYNVEIFFLHTIEIKEVIFNLKSA